MKKYLFIILSFFAFAPLAYAGTPTISSTKIGTDPDTATSMTLSSITVSSGDMLVVGCTIRSGGNPAVSTVKWNTTESFTQQVNDGSSSSIWTLATPTATTANVSITFSSSNDRPKLCIAYVVSGANTSSPIDATATGSYAHGSSLAITTSGTNELLIDSAYQENDTGSAPTVSAEGSQTAYANQYVKGSFGAAMVSSTLSAPTAGTYNMGWNSSYTATFFSSNIVAIKGTATPTVTAVVFPKIFSWW
jgi:hypothetical protein